MIANLDPGHVGTGQKTIFDAISASFAIKGGILTNDDLALQAPLISATGAGAVDLGARRLDYRLRPTLITGDQQGVSVPLLITGKWSDPAIRLDLESLARESLADEAAKIEAAAREKAAELETQARARLEAELGIVQGEGASLEDAARRRAEEALRDEAARALGGLLGGN
jgi:AsmA protein